MKKGYLIVFEGIDGSGKSTQLALLKEALSKKGYKILTTREPGGTSLGENIRGLLLDKKNLAIDSLAEALLFSASRRQVLKEIILPALEENTIVLCDRFIGSTMAYQGYGRGLDLDWLNKLSQLIIPPFLPMFTILLDVSPAVAKSRLLNTPDRMEKEDELFFQRVRQGYLDWLSQEKNSFLVSGEENIKDIHLNILKCLIPILEENNFEKCGR